MDVDLMSKMLKELILDNDKVALPGLGTFVAEIVPSSFSDRGYTINPPYRKLYFRENSDDDGLLAKMYSASNDVDGYVADRVIKDFISEMREVLNKHKVVVFPGLGRLRATKENNYFFVPDEDMDIYPEGFGLEPVSLKTHQGNWRPVSEIFEDVEISVKTASAQEESTEPAVAAVVPEGGCGPETGTDSATEPKSEPKSESGTETETETETEKKRNNRWLKITAVVLVVTVLLCIVFLGVFVLLADIAPDFIDSILYNEAELEILKY